MTLGVGIDQLRLARAQNRAIVAAVAYDIAGLEAIVAAGDVTGQPVIAQIGSSAFRYVDRDALVAAALSLANNASTPIGVHLDHSRDLDEVRRCLDDGYSSVMIDASHLEYEANVGFTREAVELARPYDAWVEAELGRIAGDEDRSTGVGAGSMTNPDEAATFVEETGVDALAVCIGNVHGRTTQPVEFDLDLLGQIASSVDLPLVLHGASGVPPETIRAAVQSGVAKINVNADLRVAYLAAVSAFGAGDESGDDLPGAFGAAQRAVTDRLVSLIEHHSNTD